MAAIDTQVDTSVDQTEQAEPTEQCAVCPHPRDTHDRISARFCEATVANGFTRGCVCSGKSV